MKKSTIFFTLLLVFLLTRLINLTKLPIFNDEAIYINWGQMMVNTPNSAFYSLFDGKQPFLMWLFGLANKIFSDPLVAGRIVSVGFSLLSFIGLYLAVDFLTFPFSLIPSATYLVTPLFVFFDRQALMESALSAIAIWSFIFLKKYLAQRNYMSAILLGATLGIGFFIKSTAAIFIILTTLVLVWNSFKKQPKEQKLNPLQALFFILSIAFLILLPLILNSQFKVIFTRGDRFNLTFKELLSFPMGIWLKNLFTTITVSFWHLTPVVFLLSILGIIIAIRKKHLFLTFFILGGILLAIFSARGLSPRYLVSLLSLFSIFTALGISKIYHKNKITGIALFCLLIIPFSISLLLIFNPLKYFNLMDKFTNTYSQKNEYVAGDSAGYGLNEVINYLNEKSQNGPLIVGVRLDAGNPENAILAYYFNNPIIKATFFDKQMFSPNVDLSLLKLPAPLYYVSRSQHQGGLENYLTEEKRFYKPEGKSYFGVYRFEAKKSL